MAGNPKQLRRQLGPDRIRVRDTDVRFPSITDLIAWQKHRADQNAAQNPKGAIRSFSLVRGARRKRKKKKACCDGGNRYYSG